MPAGASGRAALRADEVRCPVDVNDLAAAVLELVAGDYAGTLHAGRAPDEASRCGPGPLVARRYGLDVRRQRTTTIAASGSGRPAESRLTGVRAAEVLTARLRGAAEVLAGG